MRSPVVWAKQRPFRFKAVLSHFKSPKNFTFYRLPPVIGMDCPRWHCRGRSCAGPKKMFDKFKSVGSLIGLVIVLGPAQDRPLQRNQLLSPNCCPHSCGVKSMVSTAAWFFTPSKPALIASPTCQRACMWCRPPASWYGVSRSYSSWQKGGIENENGLIRQYIHKSTEMEEVSHQDVNRSMHKNNRQARE